jgi:hypothetical protein
MSYSERIRHPSGAFAVKSAAKRAISARKTLLWIVVIGAALYFLVRAGLLRNVNTAQAAPSIPNPYHWK